MNLKVSQLLSSAFAWLGERETPGSGSNNRLLMLIKKWIRWGKDDSTIAWCAIWLSQMVTQTGESLPLDPYRALSWEKWGLPADTDPQLGDIAVLDRRGGGHVGIVLRATAETVWILGGNQGNAVSVAMFPRKQVRKIRRFS